MFQSLISKLNRSRLKYEWRYRWGRTPWETEVTPPEVMAYIRNTAPGKALDLGCGTGTHGIALARLGWQVTGIDFSWEAIRKARHKAAEAGVNIDFHAADVTGLGLPSAAYDYVLDIGCLFSLMEKERRPYARRLAEWVKPHGCCMLFSWLPRLKKGRLAGISPEDVERLFRENFISIRTRIGEEKGHPCAWYLFERRCEEGSLHFETP
ncbi:MAG: methyltransferase domain-containing protein [Pseudomonadota bacterium]